MRELTTPENLRRFMVEVGRVIDIDLTMEPESDELLRAVPRLKESLSINVELERGHDQDLSDVEWMLDEGLIERTQLLSHLEQIEPHVYRFPAIDPASFRRAVEQAARG